MAKAKTKKAQPSSSSVHVPVPGQEKPPVAPPVPAAPAQATERSREVVPPTVNNDDVELLKDFDEMTIGGEDPRDTTEVDNTNGELNLPIPDPGMAQDWPGFEDEVLKADAEDQDDLNLDLCSGHARPQGFVGVDLHPQDDMTIVHDLNNGLPFVQDVEANNIRWVNGIQYMENGNPKALLKEIHRVLMPGGQLIYEGPEDIAGYPGWASDYPGLVLTDAEDNEAEVQKAATYRQVFTRVAVPDPATADDSFPRTGVDQYDDLPSDDQLASVDDLGYGWSDATSSAYGNRAHGYPSQGSLVSTESATKEHDPENIEELERSLQQFFDEEEVEKDELTSQGRDDIKDKNFALPAERKYPIHDLCHAKNALARASGKPEEAQVRAAVYRKYPDLKPVKKADGPRRIATVAVKHKGKLLMGKRRDNECWTVPGGHANPGEDSLAAARRELKEETGIDLTEEQIKPLGEMHQASDDLHIHPYTADLDEMPTTTMLQDPDGEVYRWRWVDVSNGLPDEQAKALHVPLDRNVLLQRLGFGGDQVMKCRIFKAEPTRRLVYGVVLIPDEVDSQGDWMTAEDIEESAHHYLIQARTVGAQHSKEMNAVPVESYLAPVEFQCDGQYGPQTVTKGSWVLGVKVLDDKEWRKVLDGDYQGFSVGGFGSRS